MELDRRLATLGSSNHLWLRQQRRGEPEDAKRGPEVS
jgi:hypothetical protein